ncbi:MAG: maleylpyruvate isomerase N-terminal domain-containing protein [Acidimicrobiales bacterium]
MDDVENAERVRPLDEGEAFVATLLAASPSQLTACRGWTVHEVTAHLAAGSEEIADLIESHLAGAGPRPTRSFEEREAPYRAMDDARLRGRFFEQVERSKQARQRLAHHADDAVVFTGRAMTAAEFATHSRSERAIHRWDIVGRDEIGWEMLAHRDLTLHALKILTDMTVLAEALDNRLAAAAYRCGDFEVRLRSDPHDDVVVSLSGGSLTAHAEPPGDGRGDACLDPAARLRALGGRREPSAAIHMEGGADRDALWCLFGW